MRFAMSKFINTNKEYLPMNILLIYPKYPDTFWSFQHVLKFVRKRAAYPPLGLLTVAAMLPKRWNKQLVDLNVEELKDETLAWADLILISAMIVQSASVKEILIRCAGKRIVAGGPLFTTQYEDYPSIDHFVLNEAEVTLPLFLNDFRQGTLQHIYASEERPDIRKTPIPLWSLINLRKYVTMGVQYSRGCPFNCEFCTIIVMNGRVPRTKTPKQMLREFDSLYRAGWRGSVFIVDDNFIGNTVQVKQMLIHLIDWQRAHRHPFVFLTEASINLADDEELMHLMSAANFSKVFLGLETPNADSLTECGKIQNTGRSLTEAVKQIHRHGMQVMGGFIVGFDNDRESIFDAQVKFIQEAGVVTAMVGLLTAMPQTRLWYRLKAEGRLVATSSGENTDGQINYIPKMKREHLLQGYRGIMTKIYSHKHYYRRINTFIKTYRPTARNRFSYNDFHAFFRSTWRIGVISRARFHYWWLLIRTTFTRTRSLPVAVELAIMGLHYEKMSRRVAIS
jgi:radical SAM superfamily enzyme YgiQ (UPF0313 family)